MSPKHLLLLAAAASLLTGCYYDDRPYPDARYQRHGSGYNTRYGYDDPWEVGYTEPNYRSSTHGGFGFHGGHAGHIHGPSCGCDPCQSRYRSNNKHGSHKSSSHKSSSRRSSSSSHKPSSSSSRKPSSSSSRKPSSSSNKHKSSSSGNRKSSSSGNRKSSSSSQSDRAKEWQKDKGGNPRAKRR